MYEAASPRWMSKLTSQACDARVAPIVDRSLDLECNGEWYFLSVQITTGGEWLPLGQRRTKGELLAMVKQVHHTAVQHKPIEGTGLVPRLGRVVELDRDLFVD